MSTLPNFDCFIFVIKTNSYAGNFEREMCGYVTGQVGECGVGDENAAFFQSDNPDNDEFEDLIISFPDDHGCYRPVTIWGNESTDVAIFFESQPTEEQLTFLRQRAREFAVMTDPENGKHTVITISGFELIEYTVIYKEDKIILWGSND